MLLRARSWATSRADLLGGWQGCDLSSDLARRLAIGGLGEHTGYGGPYGRGGQFARKYADRGTSGHRSFRIDELVGALGDHDERDTLGQGGQSRLGGAKPRPV